MDEEDPVSAVDLVDVGAFVAQHLVAFIHNDNAVKTALTRRRKIVI